MGQYQNLRNILLSTLPEGNTNLYYQPPEGKELKYPCIIYNMDDMDKLFANNNPYNIKKRYKVMVIDRDPLSPISDNVAMLPTSSWVTGYTSNDLNHFIHNIYFTHTSKEEE